MDLSTYLPLEMNFVPQIQSLDKILNLNLFKKIIIGPLNCISCFLSSPLLSLSLGRPPHHSFFAGWPLTWLHFGSKKLKSAFLLHTSLASKLRIAFVWASSIPFVACVQQRKWREKTFARRSLSWPVTIKIDDVTSGSRSVVRLG